MCAGTLPAQIEAGISGTPNPVPSPLQVPQQRCGVLPSGNLPLRVAHAGQQHHGSTCFVFTEAVRLGTGKHPKAGKPDMRGLMSRHFEFVRYAIIASWITTHSTASNLHASNRRASSFSRPSIRAQFQRSLQIPSSKFWPKRVASGRSKNDRRPWPHQSCIHVASGESSFAALQASSEQPLVIFAAAGELQT